MGVRTVEREPRQRVLMRVPWAGNYPAAVGLALLALCPFIVLSTAPLLFQEQLTHDLHTTRFGLQLAAGLADAGYAFGAVVAADLNQRIPSRVLYLICEAVFVGGSVLAALSGGIAAFTVGRVLQGVATGMLLVAALPPLVTNHGADKLPATAAFVNLGLFGMVTLGPTVGGITATFDAWRPLFLGVAGLGALGFALGWVAFDRSRAPAPTMGFDFSAIPVALAATVLPFFGVSWLERGGFTSPGFLVPVIVGLAALFTLVVRQYHKRRALMPMKLLAHTLPIAGVSTAMVTGAAFTTLIELTAVYLLRAAHQSPLVSGGQLAAQLLGIAVAAWLFKRILPSRWLPAYALFGMVVTALGGVVLLVLGPQNAAVVVTGAGLLLGFGAGAGVAPGLFMAGLSVPSNKLGPTFALVELLRAEAAYLVGPVLLQVAMLTTPLADGVHLSVLIVVIATAACIAAIVGVLALGGKRPHAPALQQWLDGEQPAYDSPPFAAEVRRSR